MLRPTIVYYGGLRLDDQNIKVCLGYRVKTSLEKLMGLYVSKNFKVKIEKSAGIKFSGECCWPSMHGATRKTKGNRK